MHVYIYTAFMYRVCQSLSFINVNIIDICGDRVFLYIVCLIYNTEKFIFFLTCQDMGSLSTRYVYIIWCSACDGNIIFVFIYGHRRLTVKRCDVIWYYYIFHYWNYKNKMFLFTEGQLFLLHPYLNTSLSFSTGLIRNSLKLVDLIKKKIAFL